MNARFRYRLAMVAILGCSVAAGMIAQQPSPSAAPLAAPPAPELIGQVFRELTTEELSLLRSGKPLILQDAKPKKLSLSAEAGAAGRIRERFSRLNPNYFAEFLLVLPAREGFLSGLESLLSDPRKFIGIPYYSARNDFTYELFDKVEPLGTRENGDGETVVRVLQHMEPFDDYEASYTSRRGKNDLYFSFENEGPLVYSYRNFKAAGPNDQVWMLYVFEREGFLWFYGAGGVRAFDLFGAFRSRLEASFMGRIESFFTFVMKSLAK